VNVQNSALNVLWSAEGEFNETDAYLLKRFVEEADRLAHTRLVREKFSAPLSFGWEADTGPFSAELPPRESRAEFIHGLRPFALTNEPVFLPKIKNRLAREFTGPHIHQRLQHLLDRFLGRFCQSLYVIKMDQTVLNSEETLFRWLNACEYHRDEDTRQAMARLHTALPPDVCEVVFLDLLINNAEAVLAFRAFIRGLLEAPANNSLPFSK
jgi:hypothetical protein